MVRRLDRMVVREMLVPTLIGTVAVALMFMANQLIFLLKEFSLQTTPPTAIAQLILYKTPGWLQLTLPVGSALGASLAITRLARESEITALRAAGVPILRILLPVTLFGAVLGALNYVVVEIVKPPSEQRFQRLASELAVAAAAPTFAANAQVRLNNFQAFIGQVSRDPDGAVQLNDLLLVERPRVGAVSVITADRGSYRNGIWKLEDAVQWEFEKGVVNTREAKSIEIDERIVVENLFLPPAEGELTREQLRKAIADRKRDGNLARNLEIEYHTRLSVPVACVVFTLVAPIFGILFGRSGGFVGVLLSVVLVVVYFNAYVVSTEVLGKNGLVAPWIAAWLPNLLFAVIGLIGIRRLE